MLSGSTHIDFSLVEPAQVSLTVMDNRGQILDVVACDKMDAGDHNLLWNPPFAAKGVYFLVMETGNERTVRKMVLQ